MRTHVSTGTLAGWFQQVCTASAALLVVPVVTRRLGQTDAGVWLSFQSIALVATLADFGFGFVTSRQVAYALGRSSAGDKTIAKDIDHEQVGWQGIANTLALATWLNRLSVLAGAVVLGVIGYGLVHSSKFDALGSGSLVALWSCLAFSILVRMLTKPFYAVQEGAGQLPLSRVLNGSQQLISSGGSTVIAMLGGGLVAMAFWVCLVAIIEFAVVNYLITSIPAFRQCVAAPVRKQKLIQLFRVSLPLGVVSVSGYMFSSIQVPLVAAMLGPKDVSSYYVAQRLGQFMTLAVLQFAFPVLPVFTSLLGAGRNEDALQKFTQAVRRVCLFASIGGALFWISQPFVSRLLFGVTPLPSSVVGLMAFDFFLLTVAGVWGQFVLASGVNPFLVPALIAGGVNVLLLWLLLPRIGIVAIPLSTLCAGLASTYWVNLSYGMKLRSGLRAEDPSII